MSKEKNEFESYVKALAHSVAYQEVQNSLKSLKLEHTVTKTHTHQIITVKLVSNYQVLNEIVICLEKDVPNG